MNRERRMHMMWFIALVIGETLRVVMLNRWPGINGDEAWYGVNVQEFLNGGTPFWRTGIGNPISPLHSGLLLIFSLVFKPSASLLRAPEVGLGITAVAVAYSTLRRSIGDGSAFLVAAMLAVSPTAVAYSRIGWDPSGTQLVTLLAIAWAMADRPALALIAFAFAYWIHPTNVFVLPIVLAAWAPYGLDRYRAAAPAVRSRLLAGAAIGVVVALPVAAWAATRIASNPNTTMPSVHMVIERVTSPSMWLHRGWGFINLLSGVSTVTHMSAPLSPGVAAFSNTAILLLLIGGLAAGWNVFRANRHSLWLLAGIAVAFAGFHVVAMDLALEPTLERYGLFMLVPLMIVVAIPAGVTATATVVLLAAITAGGYFYPFLNRGGDPAMATYRTGDVEPKRAAFAFIDHDRADKPARVIAEDWFLYWTLRYFAGPRGPVHVEPVPGATLPGGTYPAGVTEPSVPDTDRTYIVVFAGSGYAATLRPNEPVFTASDPIGRPIVQVYSIALP